MRWSILFLALSLSACSGFKQMELENALSAAQDVILSQDATEAIQGVLTEKPNARWACRALKVGNRILSSMPVDFQGKEIITQLVSIAAELCPQFLVPTECETAF